MCNHDKQFSSEWGKPTQLDHDCDPYILIRMQTTKPIPIPKEIP